MVLVIFKNFQNSDLTIYFKGKIIAAITHTHRKYQIDCIVLTSASLLQSQMQTMEEGQSEGSRGSSGKTTKADSQHLALI